MTENALGTCDRCGFEYPHRELKFQVVNRVTTSLLVCPDCLDIDHEQWRVGEIPLGDPFTIDNPRPPDNIDRSMGGFNPVSGIDAELFVGQVTVTTS